MNKKFIIPLVSLGVVVASAATILLANQKHTLSLLRAGTDTRDAQIVIDYNWVKNVDEDYWEFDLIGETQSHHPVEIKKNFAGGYTCDFKKTIDDKTYIFVTTGYNNGDSYFSLKNLYISNFYSFTNVVIDGEFVSSHGTDYQYTFDVANPGLPEKDDVVVYDPDFVGIDIRSGNLKNNYSSIKLEKITINYTCLN